MTAQEGEGRVEIQGGEKVFRCKLSFQNVFFTPVFAFFLVSLNPFFLSRSLSLFLSLAAARSFVSPIRLLTAAKTGRKEVEAGLLLPPAGPRRTAWRRKELGARWSR